MSTVYCVYCPPLDKYYTGNGTFDTESPRLASQFATLDAAKLAASRLNEQGFCNGQCTAHIVTLGFVSVDAKNETTGIAFQKMEVTILGKEPE